MRTSPYSVPALLLTLTAISFAACGGQGAETPVISNTGGNDDGSGGNGTGLILTNTGGTVLGTGGNEAQGGDPCSGSSPDPDLCVWVNPGPSCGDGEINQPENWPEMEACDDGNTLPGDGCTGICKVEPNYTCPTAGQPCVFDFECGNGEIEPGEVCDDGNAVGNDGCSANCAEQSRNFVCITPGQPCERIVFCGDGRVAGDETCEDGNTDPGDGCDAECNLEAGWICAIPGQPCEPSPMCGDGVVTPGIGEVCDDGNTNDDDGCGADCSFLMDGWACATPGAPCENLNLCGDGRVTGGEACDDGNTAGGDGCKEDCKEVEIGFECPFPDAPCIALCGDGILLPAMEICDDGNRDDGDGCTSICRWEDGFACTGTAPNYSCKPTVCGDGFAEGTESCDDGNSSMGDGCTPFCDVEPICDSSGCTSTCGDGLLLTGEACDDGNNVNGDGCSSSCQIEPGYECTQPPLGSSIEVPVVYRDFKSSHPDFEPGATGCEEVSPNMVAGTLDEEGKPTLGSGADVDSCSLVTSAASFAEWYRDVSGTNQTIVTTMTLYDNGNGGYVNRYGENGEPFTNTIDGGNEQGGYGTDEASCHATCTQRTRDSLQCENVCRPEHDQVAQTERELEQAENANPPDEELIAELEVEIEALQAVADECDADCAELFATREAACQAACLPCSYDDEQWCIGGETAEYDGAPYFFPIDDTTFTPAGERTTAVLPPTYGGNWEEEPSGAKHNFHFTSEVRFWFKYDASADQILEFTGDDDVWVFINRKLAVDLGGIHIPVDGSVNVRQAAQRLGLTDGAVYEIVVFQAERQTEGSSYKLTLSGFNVAASECGPICGDGVVSPGEQCDDGQNLGGYNNCNPDCTRGAYCGDGIVQEQEACDNGQNMSAYEEVGGNACAPGCRAVSYCGDGIVQGEFGEKCDDGVNDGAYGGCNPDCSRAPFCGDGTTQPDYNEQCDDGLNNGAYNTCAPGCLLGPRCGDGVLAPEWGETCDDGNLEPGDNCSPTCGPEGICGDGIPEPELGEECDDGINDGGYGECGPNCRQGPHCGDGAVDPENEECDDGVNDSGYGECDPGCRLGPHCGDATPNPPYEQCDDGNSVARDGCSPTCMIEEVIPR